jgi:hypothetical protein
MYVQPSYALTGCVDSWTKTIPDGGLWYGHKGDDMTRPKNKWDRRDKKRKKKNGMRISGRSIFTLQDIIRKRAENVKKNRKKDSE